MTLGYASAATDIVTLVDDPAVKPLLDEHEPKLVANEQIAMDPSMRLEQFAGDVPTERPSPGAMWIFREAGEGTRRPTGRAPHPHRPDQTGRRSTAHTLHSCEELR